MHIAYKWMKLVSARTYNLVPSLEAFNSRLLFIASFCDFFYPLNSRNHVLHTVNYNAAAAMQIIKTFMSVLIDLIEITIFLTPR